MIGIGIMLALGSAVLANLAFLFEHRGAAESPGVNVRHPLRSVRGLFRSRWWKIGFSIAAGAWVLHVAALALAPLSLVQAVISAGLVLLAVLAERWFGFHIGRRGWIGLALAGVGLAFLAITVQGAAGGAHSSYSTSAMIGFEAGTIACGTLLLIGGRSERAQARLGVLLGATAGIMFGVSDVAIKALSGGVLHGPLALISPWTALAVLGGVAAFFSSARGLQLGDAIPVITMTSVASNVTAILGGIIVFGDPLGSGALEIAARAAAFATVLIAAVLIPCPARAVRVAA